MTEPFPGLDPERLPVQEDVGGWVDPIALLERARDSRHPVLLHSSLAGHPAARYSIFACDPLFAISMAGNRLEWVTGAGEESGKVVRDDLDPFDVLRELTPSRRIRNAAGLPFLGGAIGYLGYPIRRAIEALPAVSPDPAGLPDAWFGIYDAAVLFDHRETRVTLVASPSRGTRDDPEERLRHRLAALRRLLREASEAHPRIVARGSEITRQALAIMGLAEYVAGVRRALDYIAAGDRKA